uniref:Pectinesterase inhibitor domain-containing protein n=1 Tax=Kalanchoe fedtschenkoi TaxID=63787 RepID=A0A7N0TSW7_KALFE
MTQSSYILIYILVTIGIINPHLVASGNPIVDNVCSRTTFFYYCTHRFMSRPSSFHADLHKLGDIAIDLAISDAWRAREKAQEIMNRTRDVVLVGNLKKCRSAYRSAFVQLRDARRLWAVNNFGAVRQIVYGMFDGVFACRDALGSHERLLARNNMAVEYMAHIILVISNY